MPQRITKAHIDSELRKLIHTAEKVGVKDKSETWKIIRGNAGRGSGGLKEPWRLVVVCGDEQTLVDFLPRGIIGHNATETHSNLITFRLAWEYFYKKGK